MIGHRATALMDCTIQTPCTGTWDTGRGMSKGLIVSLIRGVILSLGDLLSGMALVLFPAQIQPGLDDTVGQAASKDAQGRVEQPHEHIVVFSGRG